MLRRIVQSLVALTGGVVAGSALSVAVVQGGPRIWIDSMIMLGNLLTGADDVTEPWLLRGEWRITLFTGCLIAALCSLMWRAILCRGRASYRVAAMLGAGMTAPFAISWLHSNDMAEVVTNCLGVTAAGALAGAMTFAIRRGLMRCP